MVDFAVRLETKAALAEMKRRIRGLERAATNVENLEPAFKKVGVKLDQQIRAVFRAGWPGKPLSPWTLEQRARNSGWYRQPGSGGTGRWTDVMYNGLLGKPPRGRIEFAPTRYTRHYKLTGENFDGTDVARRVQWFHEGDKSQPARPFWKLKEREQLATTVMETFFNTRVLRFASEGAGS